MTADNFKNSSKPSTSQQGFNRQLASQLRPGMALEDVKRVWGSKWEEPTRRSAGMLMGRNAGVDFSATLDRRGIVASVSCWGNFPPKYVIEGVHLGMTLDALLTARDSLQPRSPQDPELKKHGLTEYIDMLVDGCELRVSIKKDKVIAIGIERLGSDCPSPDDFVPAPEGKYPPPQSLRGAPFACVNLKLAVMQALMTRGTIDLGDEEELAMHVRGRHVDLNEEGYERLDDVYEYLARYPLTKMQLESIDTLWIVRGSDIHRYAWYNWDGESDDFDSTSLNGIENLPNLRQFSLCQIQVPLDLSPLGSLAKLEEVEIVETGSLRTTRVLLEIESLQQLTCRATDLDDPNVLDRLAVKGVKVVREDR